MRPVLLLISLFVFTACSWVKPTTKSHEVLLIEASAAASCNKLGTTTSKTLSKVIIVSRKDGLMFNELVTLAKNEAVIMGGDSVVPETEIEEGRMTFGVYRCR